MKHAILFLTAFIPTPISRTEGKAKVFILSGQSNMSGGGHVVPEGLRFDPAVGDKVQMWDASDVWNKRGIEGVAFRSLSGDGVKAIARIPDSLDDHEACWHAANRAFANRGLTLDPATKDPARLRALDIQ